MKIVLQNIALFYLIIISYDYVDYAEELKQNPKLDIRLDLVEKGPCTIPIENAPISQEEFMQKYAYKSAVIIRRSAEEKARNAVFQAKCQLENLANEFGDKRVTISTANTYSYNKYTMPLRNYLNENVFGYKKTSLINLKYGNETWYFFGENNYTEWKSLLELYERPKYELPNHEHAFSFGIAGFYTGVPFHFHGPVFAETIVGRKRWFLYDPSHMPHFDPDKSTLHWLLEEYPRLDVHERPMECILEPFEIIYFPDRWWHATLNVDNVVFISTFLSPKI